MNDTTITPIMRGRIIRFDDGSLWLFRNGKYLIGRSFLGVTIDAPPLFPSKAELWYWKFIMKRGDALTPEKRKELYTYLA